MIRSLVRWRFIDRTWTAADLNELARYWFHLHKIGAHYSRVSWTPQHLLELRLTGFPRSALGALRDALTTRYSYAPGIAITSPDPDTLVVAWEPAAHDNPPAGLGIPALADPLFEGLILEVRVTVANRQDVLESTTSAGSTLVLVGELRGSLVGKSLWGGPASASETAIYDSPTPWEDELLGGFDRFRGVRLANRELDLWLVGSLFYPEKDSLWSRVGTLNVLWVVEYLYRRLYHGLFDVPFGHPRLGGLVARVGCLAVVFAVGAFAMYEGFKERQRVAPSILVGLPLLAVSVTLLASFMVTEAQTFFSYYRPRRAEHERLYAKANRYTALTPEEAARWADDPNVRKYTADVVEAGFVHAGDVASLPLKRAKAMYRVFYAPDGVTYLVLVCWNTHVTSDGRYHYWPTAVGFECQTFLTDGGWVDSISHLSNSSPLEDPKVRHLAFPTATDPFALYQLHTAAAKEFADSSSSTPQRHETLDQYIGRQNDISEEEHRAYAARPYSRREHLRWYLQLDEPKSPSSG